MTKYYTPKLTKAQYFHVLNAIWDYGETIKTSQLSNKNEINLHERTEDALMKAQERKPRKSNGQT
tara:strand:- start:519 stop:713 length:195 start_codon:yes stop_codon:yes gene_type:complete